MVQVLLKGKIRKAKDNYRRKLERKLQQNSMIEAWRGMRTVAGFRSSSSRGAGGGVDRANKLNVFFNRFEIATNVHPP